MAKVAPRDDQGFTCGANSLDLFVDSLGKIQNPLVLDLGSVCEQNIDYLAGERGFSVRVEDLSREGRGDLAKAARKLVLAESAFDGALVWSLLDHLDKEDSRSLVVRLWAAMKPGGLVSAFFGQRNMPEAPVQQFVIEGRGLVSIRETGVRAPCRNWPNREILELFEPFETANCFILKTGLREYLFRRPRTANWGLDQGRKPEKD